MKAYRLIAWPQLGVPFDQMAYRRMLSDMSLRHVTLMQLVETSGLKRQDVRSFIELLEDGGLLSEQELVPPDSLFGSLRPLGEWLKRTLNGSLHAAR